MLQRRAWLVIENFLHFLKKGIIPFFNIFRKELQNVTFKMLHKREVWIIEKTLRKEVHFMGRRGETEAAVMKITKKVHLLASSCDFDCITLPSLTSETVRGAIHI